MTIQWNSIIAKTYLVILVFIWALPNMDVVDPIGSQWLYLSILNILMFPFWLINQRDIELKSTHIHPILFVFVLFTIWALCSYFYGFNSAEVFIEGFRLATLLGSLVFIITCLRVLKSPYTFITQLFIISLVIETFYIVLPSINFYIENGFLNRNTVSKGISANINIAAFSILYKIPFLLYYFSKHGLKKYFFPGLILMVFSISSIFLLATRGAILGVLLLPVVGFILAYITKASLPSKKFFLGLFVVPLVMSYFFTQNIFSSNSSVLNRVATISNLEQDESIGQRLGYYKFSLNQILENPFIGFGFGNWKIASIPNDIKNKSTYIVPYHSHNDFLQIGAELGSIGLLLYVLLFFLAIRNLLLHPELSSEIKIALGLFFAMYLIDANLNFPIARPINQIPLLLVFGFLINKWNDQIPILKNKKAAWIMTGLIFLSQPFALYSNYRVFKSFVEQKYIYIDFNRFDFSNPPEGIQQFEDEYPNISVTTLPIKALKALYLDEKELDKAITMTKASTKANPHLYFSEAMLSLYYSKQGKLDSAKYYAEKAYKNAPSIDLHAAFYLPFLRNQPNSKDYNQALTNIKLSNSASLWKGYMEVMLNFKDSLNLQEKELIALAKQKFPNSNFFKALEITKNYDKQNLIKADSLAKKALLQFRAKEYSGAIDLFKRAHKLIPAESAYIENIARSYMLSQDFENAIRYFQMLIDDYNFETGEPELFIGTMHHKMKNPEKGCEYLFKASEKNNTTAKRLYSQLCFKK